MQLKSRSLVLKGFCLKARIESYLPIFWCEGTTCASNNTLEVKAGITSFQMIPNLFFQTMGHTFSLSRRLFTVNMVILYSVISLRTWHQPSFVDRWGWTHAGMCPVGTQCWISSESTWGRLYNVESALNQCWFIFLCRWADSMKHYKACNFTIVEMNIIFRHTSVYLTKAEFCRFGIYPTYFPLPSTLYMYICYCILGRRPILPE